MIGKFIFVSLCLTVLVQLLLASGSSPRKEQIPAVGQKLFGLGCHNEKKRIDQLVRTIDAFKQQIPAKNTLADMENALRREKAKNQELLNAISEHVTKEHELEKQKKTLKSKTFDLEKKVLEISLKEKLLEQQKKNLEDIDNNFETLLSNFTDCKENHEVLVQNLTNQLQSCEYERKMGKKIADQSFLDIEAIKRHLNNCTVEKDSLEVEKGNSLRDKTALIANLELCEEKRKMFNNYVLDSFLRNSYFYEVEKYTRYAVARLGMLPIKNAKSLIPEFGPVINDVLSFRYPINIPSCQAAEITNNTSANPSVFIAIISAAGNFKKRNDIRETWLIHLKSVLEKNLLGISTRFGFFLGQTPYDSIQKRIEEESQRHGDIVQIEMDDSYRNLTLKSIAVLNWVRQHCAKVDLVFKVDDDVYVNVHNLVNFVRSNYQSNNKLFGYPLLQTVPVRYKGKHYISIEEYPWVNYPYYVQGPAYFMHASVVIPLLAASQTIPFNPFEDVFLTGMCREKAGAKIQISAGQSSVFNEHLPTVLTPCDLRNYVGLLNNNQFVTHSAVEDFYRNKTQCVVTESDGTKKTIDFTAPVVFKFN
ncbi:uncharacterized protein LOC124193748 [Daphnia pulex]|uniref:uncharacterized protein LOC124193748 n=1 Tax=Daphnia pulex TaxID=6669 RepID=UPI001EDE86E1|nr:uncharacterized protein LOC124193748 [Daphnia pulex]